MPFLTAKAAKVFRKGRKELFLLHFLLKVKTVISGNIPILPGYPSEPNPRLT